jgi:hypothetical protein
MHVMIGSFRGLSRLLRPLYGTKKRAPLYVWGCSICGKLSGDIREDSNAHDGWSFDTKDQWCPECQDAGLKSAEGAIDLEDLRKKYLQKIAEIKSKCGGNRHENR